MFDILESNIDLSVHCVDITSGLPTGTEFPYSVRILHAKYGSTNLA